MRMLLLKIMIQTQVYNSIPGRLRAGVGVGAFIGYSRSDSAADVTTNTFRSGEEGAVVPLGSEKNYIHLR